MLNVKFNTRTLAAGSPPARTRGRRASPAPPAAARCIRVAEYRESDAEPRPPFRGVNESFLSRLYDISPPRCAGRHRPHARADHAPGFTTHTVYKLMKNGPLWTRAQSDEPASAHPERATWRCRVLARGGRVPTALLTRSSLVRKFCARGCGRVHRWHDERLGSRGDR